MKTNKAIIALLTLLTVAGCQNTNMGPKQGVGTVGGAVLGGLAGSTIGSGSGQKWAIGVGALLGALAGSEIGASLDNADHAALGNAQSQAYTAPVGEQITWSNPNSGNYGYVQPVRDGRDMSGNYCREFQQNIVVGGQSQKGYGTACRQPDGTWRIVD